ncbi:MAG TPA: gamma-glutamylcyclotransferase [Chryseolinea sp.]
MSESLLYAFYGSLRRGMDNHALYERDLRYRRTVVLKGYALYSLVDYPYAVKTGDPRDTLVAELFTIPNPQTEQTIHHMELDAGYIFLEEQIAEGKFGIYIFATPGHDDERVPGGDWVAYRLALGK